MTPRAPLRTSPLNHPLQRPPQRLVLLSFDDYRVLPNDHRSSELQISRPGEYLAVEIDPYELYGHLIDHLKLSSKMIKRYRKMFNRLDAEIELEVHAYAKE